MYNRNYGGFDYVRIHSELLTSVHILLNAKRKIIYIDQINCTTDHLHTLVWPGASESISEAAFLLKGEFSLWANENTFQMISRD